MLAVDHRRGDREVHRAVGLEEQRLLRAVVGREHQLRPPVAVDVGQAVNARRAPARVVPSDTEIAETTGRLPQANVEPPSLIGVVEHQIRAAVAVDVPIQHLRIVQPPGVFAERTEPAIGLAERDQRALCPVPIRTAFHHIRPVEDRVRDPVPVDVGQRHLPQRVLAVDHRRGDREVHRAVGLEEQRLLRAVVGREHQLRPPVAVDVGQAVNARRAEERVEGRAIGAMLVMRRCRCVRRPIGELPVRPSQADVERPAHLDMIEHQIRAAVAVDVPIQHLRGAQPPQIRPHHSEPAIRLA